MVISRATSGGTPGADIALAVDGHHRRSGLEHQLRAAVRAGRIATGTRLPSSRSFAKELGVGRNTVADAYAQLVAEGWFESRHGAGTWVAERPDAEPGPTSDEHAQRVPRFDLRTGVPDVGAFPRAAWVSAARRALAVAPDAALGYADPRGLLQLREELAGYLARARQVTAHPSRIVVCAGFAHGLALLGDVLRQRGATTVAFEAYGHQLHRGIVSSKGLKLLNVTVDDHGAVVDELAGADAALLTPAHQFPIGVALDPARRRQAIAWGADKGSLLIEDDYDGEFRYDRQAVGAMQSLAPEHVVYAGTAAKSLAPGLRLGWLVVPESLLDEVVETKRASGIAASALDQLTLADLIASGGFDKHVRRVRLAYRRRRDQLVSILSGHASGIEVSGIAAGLHALVHLPDEDEAEVIARAAEHGLGLGGLTDFTAPGHERGAALVVGYATPPDHAYTATLRRLDTVLSRQRAPMSATVAR
jgi:GntR family transcriptional regulator/MocR family aminotransferase